MAAVELLTLDALHKEVLNFSLKSTPLNSFITSRDYRVFLERCKNYFENVVPHPSGLPYAKPNFTVRPRFQVLNFEGFFHFNYAASGGENCDLKKMRGDWRTALISFQKYCLNLLLAPKRKDFHRLKVIKKFNKCNNRYVSL